MFSLRKNAPKMRRIRFLCMTLRRKSDTFTQTVSQMTWHWHFLSPSDFKEPSTNVTTILRYFFSRTKNHFSFHPFESFFIFHAPKWKIKYAHACNSNQWFCTANGHFRPHLLLHLQRRPEQKFSGDFMDIINEAKLK